MTSIKQAVEQIEEMIPEKGFNLCGLDDYGAPDEQGLYLISNFSSAEEAEKEKADREKANPDVQYYIYPAPTAERESPAKAFMAGQDE
jgi:hypothetical protein